MTLLGSDNSSLNNIRTLFESGHTEEAMIILKDFLIDNQENGDAWNLLVEISSDPKEREYALYQANKLGAADQALISAQTGTAGVGGNVEAAVKRAMDHVKAGRKKQAQKIANEAILHDAKLPSAWFVKGASAADIRGFQESLHKLLELSKTNPEAQTYFEKLKQIGFAEKKRRRLAPIWLVVGGILIFICLLGGALAVSLFIPGFTTPKVDMDDPNITCEQLIAEAMRVSDQGCQRIGTNEVCYGNYFLDSDFLGDPEDFDMRGDVLAVDQLRSLRASPLDLVQELWGVAVFKLKANMPGTVIGQNVTFLVFGNTEIDNDSGDMSAFYFSTGLGGIKCKDIEFNGLQINTPDGSGIVFTVNGAEIELAGNAIMSANPGGEMDVTLVTGTGSISANGKTTEIEPGTFVSVPLSESLEAIGQPSDAQPLTGQQASIVCQLYGIGCPEGTGSFVFAGLTPITPSETTETPTVTGTLTETPSAASTQPSGSATKTSTTAPPNTQPPPQPTSPPAANCGLVSVTGGTKGQFSLHNGNSSPITLVGQSLTWPESNGNWTTVEFGKNNVIGSPDAPPTSMTISFGGGATLASETSVTIINNFSGTPANTGYSITLTFNIGCSKTASK